MKQSTGIALATLPVVLLAALIGIFGSDAVFWDEWTLVDLIVATRDGTASIADYLSFHGEHRIVPARLILPHLALLTQWNVRFELALSVVFASIAYAAALLLARRTTDLSVGGAALAASLTFFSLSQHENWLWGWQVSWFIAIAAIVVAILIIGAARWPWPARFAAAAALCTLATFTIGFGSVAWLALLPAIWMEAPHRARATLIWFALTALTIALYFNGIGAMIQPALHRIAPPGDLLLFFIALPASALTSLPGPALLLGFAALAAYGFFGTLAFRVDARRAMPWICLGLVSVGIAALTAIGRAALYGWTYGLNSRYATAAVLLWAAICFLAAIAAERNPRLTRARHVVVAALVVANLTFIPVFVSSAANRYTTRVCVDLAFLMPESRNDCRSAIPFRDAHAILERTREENLRPFADASWFPPVPARTTIAVARATGALEMRGDAGASLLPRAVILTSGAERRGLALLWARDDGTWQTRLDRASLAPGDFVDAWTIRGHARAFTHLGRTRLR